MIQISGGPFGGLWADPVTGSLDNTGSGVSPAGSGTVSGNSLAVDYVAPNTLTYTCLHDLRETDPDTGAQAFIFTGQKLKAGG